MKSRSPLSPRNGLKVPALALLLCFLPTASAALSFQQTTAAFRTTSSSPRRAVGAGTIQLLSPIGFSGAGSFSSLAHSAAGTSSQSTALCSRSDDNSNNDDDDDDGPTDAFEGILAALARPVGSTDSVQGIAVVLPILLAAVVIQQQSLVPAALTVGLFCAAVTATRQLIFVKQDDLFENDDDDDDKVDDLQVLVTDIVSLAAAYAAARLLTPVELDSSTGGGSAFSLLSAAVPLLGVLGLAGIVAVSSGTNKSPQPDVDSFEDEEDDDPDNPQRRLLELWDERFEDEVDR